MTVRGILLRRLALLLPLLLGRLKRAAEGEPVPEPAEKTA